MIDVQKLTADAQAAREKAEAAATATTDGGTCNLDATFYPLGKGEKAGPIVTAFRAAGLSASPTHWIGRGVMVQPPGSGQANKRHESNQVLCACLESAGWPVLPYYQMD